MVALGAFIGATNAVSIDSIIESLNKILSADKNLISLNKKPLKKAEFSNIDCETSQSIFYDKSYVCEESDISSSFTVLYFSCFCLK